MKYTPLYGIPAGFTWGVALALLLPPVATGQPNGRAAAIDVTTKPVITEEQAKALENASEKLVQADALLRKHKLSGQLVDGSIKIELPVTGEAERHLDRSPAGLRGATTERIGDHLDPGGGSGTALTNSLLLEYQALSERCKQLEKDKAALTAQLASSRKHIKDLLDLIEKLEKDSKKTGN